MAFSMKLVCGRRELELKRATPTSAGWALRERGGNVSPARGQVIYGGLGQRRTSSYDERRDIILTLSVQNVSGMAVFERTLRDLTEFFEDARLAQEQGHRDNVYLVRQMDEGFTGTTLYGRGPLYHEVLAGYLDVPASAYSVYLAGSTVNILEMTLTLTCPAYGVGKPTQIANGSGWVRFDDDGALRIWASGTNLFYNPSFENSTYSTDWAVSDASLLMAAEYQRVHQPRDMVTFTACRLCNTDAANDRWLYSTKTLTANVYTLSCYAYTDGSAVTSADVVLYGGMAGGSAALNTAYVADADNPGWYRLSANFLADAVARAEGVVVKPGKTVTVDNFQLELSGSVNQLSDPGFETGGVWNDYPGTSTITDELVVVHGGAHALKHTTALPTPGYVMGVVYTVGNTPYVLSYWTRGDGTNAGRIRVLGAVGGDIIATTSTGVTGVTYTQVQHQFVTPANCPFVHVYLYGPTADGGVCYFDDIAVYAGAPSPFILGDQGAGLSFAGATHNSTSARRRGTFLELSTWWPHPGFETLYYGGGALSVWVKAGWAAEDGLQHDIVTAAHAADHNRFMLYKNTSGSVVFRIYGSTVGGYKQISVPLSYAPNTWRHIFCTWNSGGPTSLAVNGVATTTVGTSGTWTSPDTLDVYWALGGYEETCWNGDIADLRIWGPDFAFDSGKTVADLYAAGRGKSELPIASGRNGQGVFNAEDATYNNCLFIGGVPGDAPAPIVAVLTNQDIAAFSTCHAALKPLVALPYYLNSYEGTAGTNASSGADATRSGGARIRVSPASTAEPTTYNARYVVITDDRRAPFVAGRYKVIASVRDGAAATGVFKVRAKVTMNAGGWTATTGDYKTASAVGVYTMLDLGTFAIPPLLPEGAFHQQTQHNNYGEIINYCSIDLFVWMTSGAGLNFDIDAVYLMAADGWMYFADTTNMWVANHSLVADGLSNPPRSYIADAAGIGGSFPQMATLIPSMRLQMSGSWPKLSPRRWHLWSSLFDQSEGITISSVYHPIFIYQPRYLWGR